MEQRYGTTSAAAQNSRSAGHVGLVHSPRPPQASPSRYHAPADAFGNSLSPTLSLPPSRETHRGGQVRRDEFEGVSAAVAGQKLMPFGPYPSATAAAVRAAPLPQSAAAASSLRSYTTYSTDRNPVQERLSSASNSHRLSGFSLPGGDHSRSVVHPAIRSRASVTLSQHRLGSVMSTSRPTSAPAGRSQSISALPLPFTPETRLFVNKTLYVRPRTDSFTHSSTSDSTQGSEAKGGSPNTLARTIKQAETDSGRGEDSVRCSSTPIMEGGGARPLPTRLPIKVEQGASASVQEDHHAHTGKQGNPLTSRPLSGRAAAEVRPSAEAGLSPIHQREATSYPIPHRTQLVGHRDGSAMVRSSVDESIIGRSMTPQAAAGVGGIEIGLAAGEWNLPRVQQRLIAARTQAEVHLHYTGALETLLAVQMSLDADYREELELTDQDAGVSTWSLTSQQSAYYSDLVGREMHHVIDLWNGKMQAGTTMRTNCTTAHMEQEGSCRDMNFSAVYGAQPAPPQRQEEEPELQYLDDTANIQSAVSTTGSDLPFVSQTNKSSKDAVSTRAVMDDAQRQDSTEALALVEDAVYTEEDAVSRRLNALSGAGPTTSPDKLSASMSTRSQQLDVPRPSRKVRPGEPIRRILCVMQEVELPNIDSNELSSRWDDSKLGPAEQAPFLSRKDHQTSWPSMSADDSEVRRSINKSCLTSASGCSTAAPGLLSEGREEGRVRTAMTAEFQKNTTRLHQVIETANSIGATAAVDEWTGDGNIGLKARDHRLLSLAELLEGQRRRGSLQSARSSRHSSSQAPSKGDSVAGGAVGVPSSFPSSPLREGNHRVCPNEMVSERHNREKGSVLAGAQGVTGDVSAHTTPTATASELHMVEEVSHEVLLHPKKSMPVQETSFGSTGKKENEERRLAALGKQGRGWTTQSADTMGTQATMEATSILLLNTDRAWNCTGALTIKSQAVSYTQSGPPTSMLKSASQSAVEAAQWAAQSSPNSERKSGHHSEGTPMEQVTAAAESKPSSYGKATVNSLADATTPAEARTVEAGGSSADKTSGYTEGHPALPRALSPSRVSRPYLTSPPFPSLEPTHTHDTISTVPTATAERDGVLAPPLPLPQCISSPVSAPSPHPRPIVSIGQGRPTFTYECVTIIDADGDAHRRLVLRRSDAPAPTGYADANTSAANCMKSASPCTLDSGESGESESAAPPLPPSPPSPIYPSVKVPELRPPLDAELGTERNWRSDRAPLPVPRESLRQDQQGDQWASPSSPSEDNSGTPIGFEVDEEPPSPPAPLTEDATAVAGDHTAAMSSLTGDTRTFVTVPARYGRRLPHSLSHQERHQHPYSASPGNSQFASPPPGEAPLPFGANASFIFSSSSASEDDTHESTASDALLSAQTTLDSRTPALTDDQSSPGTGPVTTSAGDAAAFLACQESPQEPFVFSADVAQQWLQEEGCRKGASSNPYRTAASSLTRHSICPLNSYVQLTKPSLGPHATLQDSVRRRYDSYVQEALSQRPSSAAAHGLSATATPRSPNPPKEKRVSSVVSAAECLPTPLGHRPVKDPTTQSGESGLNGQPRSYLRPSSAPPIPQSSASTTRISRAAMDTPLQHQNNSSMKHQGGRSARGANDFRFNPFQLAAMRAVSQIREQRMMRPSSTDAPRANAEGEGNAR